MTAAQVLDPNEWFRVGPGRWRELPELSIEMIGGVLESLPPEFGPYALLVHELVPVDKGYVSRVRVVDGTEARQLVERGVWQFFVVSAQLSRDLLARLPDVDAQTLSINGAINLQVGRPARLGIQPTSLGVVSKVATVQGDVREHQEYQTIFESAVRQVRRMR